MSEGGSGGLVGGGQLVHDWNVSMVAWGKPSNPKTFSSFSSHLMSALGASGHLRSEFDAKQLRPFDLIQGALAPNRLGRKSLSFSVSRTWMWSETGARKLSERLNRMIARSGDRGPFLDIGTLVRISPELGPQFQYCDMTIAQAARAGVFGFDAMSDSQISEAIEVQHRSLHHAEHIFAMSSWVAQSLREDYGLAADRVSVAYAGPCYDFPEPAIGPGDPDNAQILFVGWDWDRKGGPLLVEAFEQLRTRIPAARLRVVGAPGLSTAPPGVILEGSIDRTTAAGSRRYLEVFSEAACFCLPSTFDPFPIALVEAMSAGLPCVSFDTGSRSEAVIDGITGALVSPGSADDLAQALERVLMSPRRAAMGSAGRERAARLFSWPNVVSVVGAAVHR